MAGQLRRVNSEAGGNINGVDSIVNYVTKGGKESRKSKSGEQLE